MVIARKRVSLTISDPRERMRVLSQLMAALIPAENALTRSVLRTPRGESSRHSPANPRRGIDPVFLNEKVNAIIPGDSRGSNSPDASTRYIYTRSEIHFLSKGKLSDKVLGFGNCGCLITRGGDIRCLMKDNKQMD